MAAGFVLVSLELAGAEHLPNAAGGEPQNTGGIIDGVEVLLHTDSIPSPEAFAPRSADRQTRNEVALHGVSPIAWGCQNEGLASKVL